jgi:stress-induced morphogen
MVEIPVLEQRLRDGIEGLTHLELKDLTGTKDHYEAVVVAAAFEGKSRVAQHQIVYGALGELMAGPVHALALTTYTPAAYASRS